jgi:hypothetical protein
MLSKHLLLALNVSLVSLFPGNQAVELELRDQDFEDPPEDEVVIAVIEEDSDGGLAQSFASDGDSDESVDDDDSEESEDDDSEESEDDDSEEATDDDSEDFVLAQTMGVADDRDKDKEIFDIQNRIRTDPLSFIDDLEDLLDRFEGDTKIFKDLSGLRLSSGEGKAAVNECITYMKTASDVSALKWSDVLEQAAEYHTDIQGDTT